MKLKFNLKIFSVAVKRGILLHTLNIRSKQALGQSMQQCTALCDENKKESSIK